MVEENDRAARTSRAVAKAGLQYAKTFVSRSTLIVRTRRAAQMILLQILYHHSISRVVRQLASRLGRQGQLSRDEEQVCTQSRLFDREWYLQRNPDVAASGVNPLTHYIKKGAAEGRDPHPLFDSDWYLERNPEVAVAGTNPLSHYIYCGSAEGRNPNPLFDTEWYLQRNPDIVSSGMNPLTHHIHFGAAETQSYYRRSSWPRGAPTVSAIVPCYNGARWLAEALESIKAQSLPVQEIIVVDDASTDNSAEIAQKQGALVIGNPTNRGEGYSRNVGLRHASGDVIAWLDADDVWLPQHVSTLSALLQKYPRATAAFGAVQRLARRQLITCTREVTIGWRWHDAHQSKQLENHLAAVYRFRRNYWELERAAGRPTIAAEMERRMADIWTDDMNAAWQKRDMSQLRLLWKVAEL